MEDSKTVSVVTAALSALSAFSLVVAGSAFAQAAPAVAAAPAPVGPVAWTLDAAHTRVAFTVPHMVVSEVEGQFKTFSATVLLDEKDPTKSQVSFSAEVASINTDNADRDKHLKSAEFFDAQKFPTITFKSKKIAKAGKGFKITGELTMRGVTKEVTLEATLSAAVTNPWGKQVRGARITGKLDRQAFGLSWNKALDKGGVLVGDQVTIAIKAELNK